MDYLVIQPTRAEAVLARFRKQRGSLALVTASRHHIGDDEALAELLAETAPSLRDAAVKVVLSLPPTAVFSREVELPVSDRKKARDLLPLELAGETAFDSDELVFDALPLASGKTLAIWGKRPELADRIAQLADRGVEPEVVTASPFNWGPLLGGNAEGTVALTDGEALAVYEDGRPVYFRCLADGGMAEAEKTLAALEIGRGITPSRLFCFGPALHRPPHESKGATFVPLPVNGVAARGFASEEDARDLASAFAVAHTCAFDDPVNFRSGVLAYTAGRAKTVRKLRLTMALAVALVVVLFAEVGLRYFLVKRDLDSVNSSIQSIYRTVFPTRKKTPDEVAELRAEIKRLSGGGGSGNLLEVLRKVAEAKGDDVNGVYEAAVDKGEVVLKGDARSIQAVNDFKTKITSFLTPSEGGEIKSRPDGGVSFVIRGTIKEGAK